MEEEVLFHVQDLKLEEAAELAALEESKEGPKGAPTLPEVNLENLFFT